MRKTKHRGLASVSTDFMLNLIAYNLIRIPQTADGVGQRLFTSSRLPNPATRKIAQCTNL